VLVPTQSIFDRDGGFVFNTVHNTQKDCSGENLVAMYGTVRNTQV
jgi:hypothetical protein